MLNLFFKKILGNKLRILITAITISLVMFLSVLFMSIGVNSYNLMSQYFNSYPEYNYLYIEYQNEKNTNMLTDKLIDSVTVHETILEHCFVSNIDLAGISAWIYPTECNPIIPGGVIIAGSGEMAEKNVLLGNSVVEKLNVSPDDLIGKPVDLNSETGYTIIGVFDDSLSIKTVHCLIVSSEPKEPTMILVHTSSVYDVKNVQDEYQEFGCSVTSFSNEIGTAENKITLIEYSFFLVALLIIAISVAVLCASIRNFSEDSSEFLALLKAQGFLKKHYSTMIMMDSSLIVLVSIPLEFLLSACVMPLIKMVLTDMDIYEIVGFDVSAFLTMRLSVFAIACVLQIICSCLVSLIISQKIYDKSVCEILYEVNQ